jgi:hypothetical protein
MSLNVCIDVDRTLVTEEGKLQGGVTKALADLRLLNTNLILWSAAGAEYACSVAKAHGLEQYFAEYSTKPDIFLDDDPSCMEKAIGLRFGTKASWDAVPAALAAGSRHVENLVGWYLGLPEFIQKIAEEDDPVSVRIATLVWANRKRFVRWPQKQLLLWPGCTRRNDHANPRCYTYPRSVADELKKVNVKADTRSNGPAIAAFLLSGGKRPIRTDLRWGWSIHHIYDGKFPAPGRKSALHATRRGQHFTQTAGLAALHPIADGLAGDCAYFAWILRYESYKRFGYDPDRVFATCRSNPVG